MSNQQDFEEKLKNELYDKIGEMISKQSQIISSVQELGKSLNLGYDLNNIYITMNNKIVELKNEFERAGISIYSQKVENYGSINPDFITTSFIGKAIIFDLIDYADKGIEQLGKYSETMKQISYEKTQKSRALVIASPVKKFFAKIRSFFKPSKEKPCKLTQEEIEKLEKYLSDYREIDNKLFEYNLKDNLVSSIVKEIRDQRFRASNVHGLLEESVIPDLQKLGLADLIPNLQQAIIEEYKKYLPDIEGFQIKQENIHLYVPDFSKQDKQKNQTTEENQGQISSATKTEERQTKSTQDLGKETSAEQKNTAELDKAEMALRVQEKAIAIKKDSQEDPQTL